MKRILSGITILAAGIVLAADLPVKYFSYVESTGEQYVDTGYVPNNGTKITAVYQLTATGNENNFIYGVYGASNSGRCQFSHSSPAFFGWGSYYSNTYTDLPDDLNWHTNETSRGAFYVDGVSVYFQPFAGTAKNLYLFGVNGNGTPRDRSSVRIASVKIYDTNSNIYKHILQPCEMADGRIGFWDFIRGTFLPSVGSAPLIAGEEISPVRPRYISMSNNAYIDLGITPSNHETEIAFRDEKSTPGGRIFGLTKHNFHHSFFSSENSWQWGYNGNNLRSNPTYSPNVDHNLIFNKVSDGMVYMDGLMLGKAIDANPGSSLNIGRGYSYYGFEGRIYSVKLTARANNTVVLRAYPLTIADTTGLYDAISGKLLVSNVGSVVPGPVFSSSLEIAGENEFIPDGISPAPGVLDNLAAGDQITVSAPSTFSQTSDLTGSTAGWRLYEWDDASGAWVFNSARENASGTGSSFTYTHTGVPTKLVWSWEFDAPSSADARYVAPFGNDSNDGLTWATAKSSIQAAIDAAPDNGRVLVAPGTYVSRNTGTVPVFAMSVTKPVSVIGIAGPAETIVDAGLDASRALANITHAEASVSGFTFKNGINTTKNKAAGLEASAGIVSNCVLSIRGHWARVGSVLKLSSTAKAYDIRISDFSLSASENAAFVNLAGSSVLDGLVMTNVKFTGSGQGNFIYMEGYAILRNALVANNTMGSYEMPTIKPFISLAGAGNRVEDSTITGNRILATDGALFAYNNSCIVTNTIITANVSFNATNKNIHNGTNKRRFFNCCSEELGDFAAAGNITQDPQFVNAAAGDYRLRALSPARNMGVVALRPQGGPPLECAFDLEEAPCAEDGSLTVTFNGYTGGENGDISAVWDFGDGTEPSTDWPIASHTYSTPGKHTVTVTVTDASGTATYTLNGGVTVIPPVCYVKEGSTGVYPYDTWEKAAGDLKSAYDVGSRTIIVTNGTYNLAAPAFAIFRPVEIRSVEGPEKTFFVSEGCTSKDHRAFSIGSFDDILISGFTIRDGYAANYYWTASIEMSSGTITNCVFKDIRRVSRAAACYFYGTAKVVDCLFDGHGMTWSNDSAQQSGVRIEGNAVVDRCEITAFRIDNNSDSAAYAGESPVRIASANAILRNSLVHYCTNGVAANAKYRGPIGLINGRIENCTVVNNFCGGKGGGVWADGGTIVNTIFADNTAGMAGNDVYTDKATAVITASRASDFSNWAGTVADSCTTKSPNFDPDNPYHLTPLSTACIDTADTLAWMTEESLDKDQLPRVMHGGPDMGCFEFQESLSTPLDGSIDITSSKLGRLPATASFEASIVGDEEGLTLIWDFGDGTTDSSSGKTVSHTYTTAGSYKVTLVVGNSAGENAFIAAPENYIAVPEVCYVSLEGSGAAPYDTWEKAATNILDAVALNPYTVLVTNGVYKMTAGNELIISTDLELRSVNGPEVTIIQSPRVEKNRGIWMTPAAEDAVVDGFSFLDGYGYWDEFSHFARVEAGTLSNCVMSNTTYSAGYRDAAVLVKGKGRVTDCLIDTSKMGGNADGHTPFWSVHVQTGGILERCIIQGYSHTSQGGSDRNSAALWAEGTGIVRNCLVRDCTATQSASAGYIRSAVVVQGNATLENCTIVNSKSCQAGAGLTIAAGGNPTVRNNIISGSTSTDGSANQDVRDLGSPDAPRVTFSCSPDLADSAETGNISADPLFKRYRGFNYMLQQNSPCVNAGERLSWMTDDATDLLGNRRRRGRPDMGCVEVQSAYSMLILR